MEKGIDFIQLNDLQFKDENGHDETIIIAIESGQEVDIEALEKHLIEVYVEQTENVTDAANKWLEEQGIKIVPIREWHEIDYSGFNEDE